MHLKLICWHCSKVILNTVANVPDLQAEEYVTAAHQCTNSSIHGTRVMVELDNNAPQKAKEA